MIPFTAAKLELIGSGFGRALLHLENLGCFVKRRLKTSPGWDEKEGGPWPNLRPPMDSPSASGSGTPEGGSDAESDPDWEEGDDDEGEPDIPVQASLSDNEDDGCYGGICLADLLAEIQSSKLNEPEPDTAGSDSDPSEGNLTTTELTEVAQILTRRKRSALRKRTSSAGGRNRSGNLKNHASRNGVRVRAARTRTSESVAPPPTDPPVQRNSNPKFEVQMQKVVAFGGTTYLVATGQDSTPNRAAAARVPAETSLVAIPQSTLTLGQLPQRMSMPAIPQGGGQNGSAVRDRLSIPLGERRRKSIQRGDCGRLVDETVSPLNRQLQLRHVSTSVLQDRTRFSSEPPGGQLTHGPGSTTALGLGGLGPGSLSPMCRRVCRRGAGPGCEEKGSRPSTAKMRSATRTDSAPELLLADPTDIAAMGGGSYVDGLRDRDLDALWREDSGPRGRPGATFIPGFAPTSQQQRARSIESQFVTTRQASLVERAENVRQLTIGSAAAPLAPFLPISSRGGTSIPGFALATFAPVGAAGPLGLSPSRHSVTVKAVASRSSLPAGRLPAPAGTLSSASPSSLARGR